MEMDLLKKSGITYIATENYYPESPAYCRLFFKIYTYHHFLTFYHKYIQEVKKSPMENKNICSHPFYSDDRIETKFLQELCNLGILDKRHAILCYPDAATIHIGYLDMERIDSQCIPFFEGGCIEIYLYSDNNPVRYHKDVTTFKDMELIHLIYKHWGALVTVLMNSVSEKVPTTYALAKANVEKWSQMQHQK